MYSFAWQTPAFGGRLRSPHAIDVPFTAAHRLAGPHEQQFERTHGNTKALGGGGIAHPLNLTKRKSDAASQQMLNSVLRRE